MNKNAVLILGIVSIASDMRTAFNYGNAFAGSGHPFCKSRASKPCSNHYPFDGHDNPMSKVLVSRHAKMQSVAADPIGISGED
jgi:hypothetical protein